MGEMSELNTPCGQKGKHWVHGQLLPLANWPKQAYIYCADLSSLKGFCPQNTFSQSSLSQSTRLVLQPPRVCLTHR